MPAGFVAAADCLRRVDAAAVGGEWDGVAARDLIAAAAAAAEASLDPVAGVMVRAVWLDAGDAACRAAVAVDPSSCG